MANKKEKWLWISPRAPEPTHSGAQLATKQLIKYIAKHVDVDLLCLPPTDELPDLKALSSYSLNDVIVLPRSKKRFLDLLLSPFFPFTYSPFKDPNIVKSFNSLNQKNKYDLILLDGLHACVPLIIQKSNLESLPPFAYRSHNVEADLWRQELKKRSFLLRPFLMFQYYLVKKIEMFVLKKALATLTIAQQDLVTYQNWDQNYSIFNVPLGFEFSNTQPMSYPSLDKIKLGFIGRLDWAPNKNGLIWFLNSIWPSLDKTKFELIIAGSGNSDFLASFEKNFTFLGRVERVEDFYERVHLSIIPVFYGSGVRVKVIESYLFGRPCISTKLAMNGSDMMAQSHYWEAQEVNEWVLALNNLNQNEIEQMSQRGRAHLSQSFESEVVALNLLSYLKTKG
jgi:polysaccharide biosynthesis protein PslH